MAFLELLLAVAAMGGWISKQVRYAPHTARRWAANLNGLSPEEAYAPLRRTPELFESLLRDEWLAPTLLDVVAAARRGQCHRDLREEAPGVFSFAMFSDAFCRDFLREVDGYMDSGLPIRRPNSMNNYGLIVNEIGMLDVISELQREVLWPIARSLWPKEGSAFHAHHSFMVQYRKTEDPGLDMHTDDSDVTFNVCLGEVFAGAGLTFCGGVGTPDHRQRAPASVDVPRKTVARHRFAFQYEHVKGRAVVHLGSKRHGADDISSGTRRNLIIWNHNRNWRASAEYETRMRRYRRESAAPDARCLSYTHDRDFAEFKPYPPGKEEFAERAWCPPQRACYDRMK